MILTNIFNYLVINLLLILLNILTFRPPPHSLFQYLWNLLTNFQLLTHTCSLRALLFFTESPPRCVHSSSSPNRLLAPLPYNLGICLGSPKPGPLLKIGPPLSKIMLFSNQLTRGTHARELINPGGPASG